MIGLHPGVNDPRHPPRLETVTLLEPCGPLPDQGDPHIVPKGFFEISPKRFSRSALIDFWGKCPCKVPVLPEEPEQVLLNITN